MEWSFQQSNKYPVFLYWFSVFVQVKLGKRLYKQAQVSICTSGGLSVPTRRTVGYMLLELNEKKD